MKDYFGEDTIVALSTPPGRGAIAVIRMSGSEGLSLIKPCFSLPIDRDSHRQVIIGEFLGRENKQLIDECVVTFFLAPHSYTGEDVVEISCHCNPLIIDQIIQELLGGGARLAQPGEFTKRAFLNRKIDLSQAEAVAGIIKAKTREGLSYSMRQLEGGLSARIHELKENVVSITSLIEVNLDFNEDDIQVYQKSDLVEKAKNTLKNINTLLHTYDYGRLLQEGLKLLLLGKPNVGKSSLLNALAERERAIVSDIPGTTRDYIEEHTQIEGFPIQIVDTAGIRETLDMIEEMGVKRALGHIETSDLILAIFEAHQKLDSNDRKFIDYLNTAVKRKVPFIVVLNKIDLGLNPQTRKYLHGLEAQLVEVSAKKGTHIPQLKEKIKHALVSDSGVEEEDVIVNSVRHKEVLGKAQKSMQNFTDGILQGMDEVILASELRSTLDYLGEIVGEITSEDLLNNIFENFCIGK
jgi:tRNA modification GTPase